MRLINTQTHGFEEHFNPGPYAILSHTWREGEEISFAQYTDRQSQHTDRKSRHIAGYLKIHFLCEQARCDGLKYAWIDTCCIDKSSSAELSEAINSMYAWYQRAELCYVYLDDVKEVRDIQHCRWLSRGWTLQELIAPANVRFYGIDWTFLGTKSQLLAELVAWTNIDQVVLEHNSSIEYMSVATRMSWAASRRTTRIEDMAYCLLGIFGVNMPLIYGEREKAFTRLQEEILKQTRDVSLLAFDRSRLLRVGPNLFAVDPAVFLLNPKIIDTTERHCEMSSAGLVLDVQLILQDINMFAAALGCRFEFDHGGELALTVRQVRRNVETELCFSISNRSLITIPPDKLKNVPYKRILLLKEPAFSEDKLFGAPRRYVCCLQADELLLHGYEVIYAAPDIGLKSWNEHTLCSEIETHSDGPIVRKFAFAHRSHDEAFIISQAILPLNDFDAEIWLNAKIKPAYMNCESWLKEENMYSVTQHSTDRYRPLRLGGGSSKFNFSNEQWVRISTRSYDSAKFEPYDKLSLLSQTCFASINVSAKRNEVDRWTFTFLPNQHA